MFGIINVLLFFPSGALYPVESYPRWLAAVSSLDPLTYGVRALRGLLLRDRGRTLRQPAPNTAVGTPSPGAA